MSDSEPKRKLVGPWSSLHLVIWVIGLYILFTRGPFFPGILVLVAISALYEAFIRRYVPDSTVEENETPQVPVEQPKAEARVAPPVETPLPSPLGEHPIDRLPHVCPNCGGPILSTVKWTGPFSASCPYCGTNLPLSKAN